MQMKNLDSPTLNSTLFKDMDTCRAAVIEKETEKEEIDRKSRIGLVIIRIQNKKDFHHLLTR